jgi:hypothetical protein
MVIDYIGASNLPLNDFKIPVVLSALPCHPWQDDAAEHGLRSPWNCFVHVRTKGESVRKLDFAAHSEVGDLT